MTTTIQNKQKVIKDILEKLYIRYNHRDLIKPDPLQFIYNYSNPGDIEIIGLLSAALAYGRVEQIQNSLTKLFAIMGDNPSEFVLRFNTGNDIADLLELLKMILKKHDSIEKYFLIGYDSSHENIIPALSAFCDSLLKIYSTKHNGKTNQGLGYLIVSPTNGSPCKRMNLFLRWMVRNDEVDSGIWKSIDKSKLIVPIDVHMGRLCRFLGFHDKNTISLKTAIEITKHFAEIQPDDPVKYDFALSRIGIVENCTGKYNNSACPACELNMFCKNR